MSGLIAGLAGAGGAASTAGGYYQNAANELVSATGSPAAQMFSAEEMAALRPLFNQQTQGLLGTEAATGLGGSGAGRAMLGDLTANQSATLASNIAPLYSQALGEYGNIIGAMPGAQTSAYQDAINNFYQGIGGLGEAIAGMPPTAWGGGGGAAPAAWNPYEGTSEGGSVEMTQPTYYPAAPAGGGGFGGGYPPY
jgi:hypothetical protein